MKHTLSLRGIRHEIGDIYSFTFEPNDEVIWRAGQYALFTIEGFSGEGKPSRTFTIASSPSEGVVMFSTRIDEPCSDFKKRIKAMKVGDALIMDGPYGKLCINDPTQPTLLLAGGVGITPFRALVMDMDTNHDTLPYIALLYNNSKGHFAYRDVLDDLKNKHDHLHIHYIQDRETCIREIERFVTAYKNKGQYLISGSPGFVNAMEKTLIDQDIDKERMKHDPFYGY